MNNVKQLKRAILKILNEDSEVIAATTAPAPELTHTSPSVPKTIRDNFNLMIGSLSSYKQNLTNKYAIIFSALLKGKTVDASVSLGGPRNTTQQVENLIISKVTVLNPYNKENDYSIVLRGKIKNAQTQEKDYYLTDEFNITIKSTDAPQAPAAIPVGNKPANPAVPATPTVPPI